MSIPDVPVVPPGPARRPLRRRLLYLAGGVLVLGIALVVAHLIRVHLAWTEFQRSQQSLRSRIDSEPVSREPWLDPAIPGDAWKGYADAARNFRSLPPDIQQVILDASIDRATVEEQDRAAALIERFGSVFRELRIAASRQDVRIPIEWHRGHLDCDEAVSSELVGLRMIARALRVSALSKARAGRWKEVVDDVILGLQVGCDITRRVPIVVMLMGRAIVGIVTEAPAEFLRQPGIPQDEALRLAVAYERCEREMTTLDRAMEYERLVLGETMKLLIDDRHPELDSKHTAGLRLSEWRSGFSLRIAARDVDAEAARYSAEVREAASLPWSRCTALHSRWLARSLGGGSRRPVFIICFMDHSNGDEMARLGRSHLRLARAGALYRAGRDGPMPQDPFTLNPLHREVYRGELILWSEGSNGDQGGSGGWWGGIRVSQTPDTVLRIVK